MTTDTSERGLERLICAAMTGDPCDPGSIGDRRVADAALSYRAGLWIGGEPTDYDREYCVDLVQLRAFLAATQPTLVEPLGLHEDGPTRRQFLARLEGEVAKRGTVDVLRHGIKHGPHEVQLFFGSPTPGNAKAEELHQLNRFSVSRQLRYSRDETQRALDLGLFINGLPIATFELKNSLTKQTVADAVEQYKRDRNAREKLFALGRCLVHFAVDDAEVRFCTQLKDKASWFLPFNKGWNDGAGNPPNPAGLKTDYLWNEILTPRSLTDIIENYAQLIVEKDAKSGRKRSKQVWPRYHQLDVVRKLLADARAQGSGRRYLVQHSAGSGKSNSIAWLTHQLVGLQRDQAHIFDTVIVVTDRRILDQQIRETIRHFAQVKSTIGAVTGDTGSKTKQLAGFLADGKKIIICTVQTFPHVLDAIGSEHRGKRFALIIDEAHSSQGGKTSGAVSRALGDPAADGEEQDEETTEDKVNRIMEGRKMLANASYFAFTATPKNKTEELFGEPFRDGEVTKRRPFHAYTMKQAIQEGFILDVLAHYTPVESYYKLAKTVAGDPEYDTKKARKKLRRYVESHDHAIRLKAEIMVDHFHEQVLALRKIGGKARAMVVTGGIARAIQYFHAFRAYLGERNSPHQAIVAFSGEHEYHGEKVTEASLNGFPSSEIAERIQQGPYRFLICADKFQTGYDEPLLHSMYVDKTLSGIKAVQALSRLNRAHPDKRDTFVLDFVIGQQDAIEASFATFYRTTILSGETDPNKLHDLKIALDQHQVYDQDQVDELVRWYLDGADRDKLDPILDACVADYLDHLDENGQIDFKGKAKAFLRTYGFLAAILPYTNADWERLSIFLTFLVPKLPSPKDDDFADGILDAIDMDSYRIEKQAVRRIQLPDADGEIEPVPTSGGGRKPEPEMDRLSNIIKSFNEQFGNIDWNDADRVYRLITQDIPDQVAKDVAFQNALKNTPGSARVEYDNALARAMIAVMKDDTQLYKMFSDHSGFKRWLGDTIFEIVTGSGERDSA